MTPGPISRIDETALLDSARSGDETAFRDLVEVHRSELQGHCYRMLASVHDAEDAVQDALVRAWKGLARFEGRSSVRTWLFKIATHAALDQAGRRGRRELPLDLGPASGPGQGPGDARFEILWLEPCPDSMVGGSGELSSPEARYERRESVELAFVAALQDLPAQQRAVLILRDVLAFSAREVAEMLDTTVAAANSALQRARAAANRLPEHSQQVMLRALGDEKVRNLAARYGEAIENGDIETLLSMLTEDAAWSMPPLAGWYRGPQSIAEFLRRDVFPERWRHRTTGANGQLAVAGYILDDDRGRYVAAALDVLTLDGGRIAQVTGFLAFDRTDASDQGGYRFVGADAFAPFGLPGALPI
jgi:RNA polymerase sigma-70 factor (ECF subfamily)